MEIFHSNVEGEVINKFYEANDKGVDACIINPAGFSSGYRALYLRELQCVVRDRDQRFNTHYSN